MKLRWLSFLAILIASPVYAQEVTATAFNTGLPTRTNYNGFDSAPIEDADDSESSGGFLKGDKGFRNFIGYVSNPVFAIDPRSLTQILPIYAYSSVRGLKPLPDGEISMIGPALSIAITERLNIGLTSGGPALTSFPNHRSGWLDIGGYAQYTVIRDVPNQFIATAGLGWTTSSGSSSIFQGEPPWKLAPYVTVGKEFGDFHLLNTTGYRFSAGSGDTTSNSFYGTVHLDRRCFGWLYPLVEFNWIASTAHININDPLRRDFFGLDSFTADGSLVTVAPGVNAVIIQDKLELGAVYQTPIYSENHIHFNSFLVKMVIRF